MMSKSGKVIPGILIMACVFLSGCFERTYCPGYSGEYLNWMMYSMDNNVSFSNGTDTVEFIVQEAFCSSPYSFRNNCDCGCESYAYFETGVSEELGLQIAGTSYYDNSSNIIYEYSFIKSVYDGGSYIPESSDRFGFGKENGIMSEEIISQFTVGDVVYHDVIKLELDTVDDNSPLWRKPEVWRVFVADSVGVIKYDYCDTGEEWEIIKE